MKKLALLVCLIGSSASLMGQPSQFSNLLTNQTDHTCGGLAYPECTTWPMPGKPAPGASYHDPTFGTTTYRLATLPANTSGTVIPAYSRVQAWNSNNTLMTLVDLPPTGGVYLDLYDATKTPPSLINRISVTSGFGPDAIDGDALWANTDPRRIYYQEPSGSGHGTELRYIDVSTCTRTICTLTPVVVHTFSCNTGTDGKEYPLGNDVPGNKIETGSGAQGSMFDKTDRYFSFTCDVVENGDRHEIDFIRYDRQENTVTYQDRWYKLCPGQTPSGCRAWLAAGSKDTNLVRMNQHPDHEYITMAWQTTSVALCHGKRCDCPTESSWVRSCGTEVYDDSYNFLGPASAGNTHQDTGYDIHGNPVWIGSGSYTGTIKGYRALAITNLKTLNPTKVVTTHILLPCSFSYVGPSCDSGTFVGYQKPWHIAATSWSGLPGWALLSTFMYSGPGTGMSPKLPSATTLGAGVTSPGTVTVRPTDMTTIGPGVLSIVDFGTSNEEMVTWTVTNGTTATATFAKTHSATAHVQCVSCMNTGWGASELDAIKIDASAPDMSNAVIYRIGRTHAVRDADYNCEAHATVNRNFTAILWGSSWDRDCNANSTLNGYWIKLQP
jgi:hypothetical protein